MKQLVRIWLHWQRKKHRKGADLNETELVEALAVTNFLINFMHEGVDDVGVREVVGNHSTRKHSGTVGCILCLVHVVHRKREILHARMGLRVCQALNGKNLNGTTSHKRETLHSFDATG